MGYGLPAPRFDENVQDLSNIALLSGKKGAEPAPGALVSVVVVRRGQRGRDRASARDGNAGPLGAEGLDTLTSVEICPKLALGLVLQDLEKGKISKIVL
jgi:hypothetical protein